MKQWTKGDEQLVRGALGRMLFSNDDVKKNAEFLNASNGVSDYDNPVFSPIRETEYNYEINYGFHVTNWLTVRPNLQYITHPGGVDEVDNALVAGLKIQSVF